MVIMTYEAGSLSEKDIKKLTNAGVMLIEVPDQGSQTIEKVRVLTAI